MKLRQYTKWELLKLIGSLPDQEKVKKKLNEIECDRKYVKRYLKKLKFSNPDAVICDARDLKRFGFDPVKTANAMKGLNEDYKNIINGIMDAIEDIPSAYVKEVVHAKWEYDDGMDLVCSACGGLAMTLCYETVQYRSAYCPSCGAKMDGGKTT